jgi:hypothetical protein
MQKKLLFSLLLAFTFSLGAVAQTSCPTPNSTPTLAVQSFDGANVTLSFATPNPNVFTDYYIVITNRDGIILGIKSELSFNLADIPTTNGYGFYVLAFNQADADVAVPNLTDALAIVCPGISLPPVNGHYPLSDVLLGILNNCPDLIQGGQLSVALDLLCQLPVFVPDVVLPFGWSGEMVTGINNAQTNPLSATVTPTNNQWLVQWQNNNSLTTQVTVYNSTGQMVYKTTLSSHQNNCSIDTQQLTNGLYMVQISNGQTNSVAKIVK